MALLGAILHNNRAYERVADIVEPGHFASHVHGEIYSAIRHLIDVKGQIADPITLKTLFEADDRLKDVGGYAYLMKLAGSVASIVNAQDYATTVRDLAIRRALITIGEDTVNDAYKDDLETGAEQQLDVLDERLDGLRAAGGDEAKTWNLGDALGAAVEFANRAYRRDGQLLGVPTGFKDLDSLLGGLCAPDLIILAGRPSMGKTAKATNIAFHAAARAIADDTVEPPQTYPVAFFSLEMSAEQLAMRIIADQASIPIERIRRGDLSHADFEAMVRVKEHLATIPLFIDDTPNLTLAALRSRARRLVRKHGIRLIVIDYLQLIEGAPGGREENRARELSKITRGLKALGKTLGVPILALSQVGRQVEERDDKRPQLSDLRESGSIEQDADVVIFVYRDEYYLARKEPREGTPEHVAWRETMDKVHKLAEAIVAKQRQGAIGKATLVFEGAYGRFSNYVADDHLPDQQGNIDYGNLG